MSPGCSAAPTGTRPSRARDASRPRATLADLGIRLEEQRNVELDVERRPTKSPRAFCAPIEVPGRVVLVIQPNGGPEDWHALFHEAGHTEHFAHTSPSLKVEERLLGDDAVTEGWAALFDHLSRIPRASPAARLRTAARVRRRVRAVTSSSRAGTPRSCSTSSSRTARRRSKSCGRATSSCSATP